MTHGYRPSSSDSLFALPATLENRGSTPIQPSYRRVMDWDVEIPNYDDDEYSAQKKLTGSPGAFVDCTTAFHVFFSGKDSTGTVKVRWDHQGFKPGRGQAACTY